MMNLVPFTPPVAACAFLICTASAGYADFFGDFTYEEYDTYIEITDYPEYGTGEVIVPSEIVGKPVTSIGAGAFRDLTKLTGVTIPDSVTSIGVDAFYGCSGLKSVTIPNSVTSIGFAAFKYCSGLTSINIPDSVTSVGDRVFSQCISLTNVTIPDGVTSIGDAAFRWCSSLTSIYFEGNAPILGTGVFTGSSNVIGYYLLGTTAWGPAFPAIKTEEAPLGGIPVAGLGGWFVSEWFGYYATTVDPWLFHARHGFIYRYPESTNASLYFFDDVMVAWWWTSEANYPSIYAFNPPADNTGTDIESA